MRSLERLTEENAGLMTDIKKACQNKQAFLFVKPDAGWVLKPLVENGVVGVFIWAAWSERRDGLAHYQPEIEHLARQIGGRWLRFHSARKGFLKVAPRLGWQHQGTDEDGFYIFQQQL